jgi:anti-sigma factor RsiW
MICNECRDLLPALALGELPDNLQRDAEMHLTSCPSCQAEFRRLQSLCRLMDDDAASDSLSELEKLRLESALYRQLADEKQNTYHLRGRLAVTLTRLAAAIMLFVLGYAAHSLIAGNGRPGTIMNAGPASPALAVYDADLSGGLRFSAVGLKLIAQGRKSGMPQLDKITAKNSDLR